MMMPFEITSGKYSRAVLLAILVAGMPAMADDSRQKADALLARMSLEEKVGQMTQVDILAVPDPGDVARYFLGSMLSGGSSDPADNSAATWRSTVETFKAEALKTRLKIPLLYGIDAVHGHNNVDGAVVFPHNIGLGATRNPRLVQRAARVTAQEVSATGIRWTFAPCVAVGQNDRWGRTYESFSDDPELAATLGVAAIAGFQGSDLSAPDSVLACAKHFIGDGGTLNGTDQGNAVGDEAALRKLFLPPYAAAVKAGAGSVMVSYSSWNGKKMHGNKYLITGVLKGELGFQGFVVSDWAAIDQLGADYAADIEASVNAGVDMVMIPHGPGKTNNYVEFIHDLVRLVHEGRVSQARVDDAVRRILMAKFQLGLFDEPPAAERLDTIGSVEHRAVARECVRESLVLLKNANDVLPLSKNAKRIVVVGPTGDDLGAQCGGWTIGWQGSTGAVTKGGTTILKALRSAAPAGMKIEFSPDGSSVSGADAAIVVVAEKPYAEMKGDTKDLRLPEADAALIGKVKSAGVPVITILLSGRPLILGRTLERTDALIAAWLPGTEGQGVADVLYGDCKPTGKLPRNWPRANEQLTGQPTVKNDPLFPIGFGLTYEKYVKVSRDDREGALAK